MSALPMPRQAALDWSGCPTAERDAVQGYERERKRVRGRRWLLRRRESVRLAEEKKAWRKRRAFWKHLRQGGDQ